MNDNILMENPLAILQEFQDIPDEAFAQDKEEILGLVRTIVNSDDFILFLSDVLTTRPESIETDIKNLKLLYNNSKNAKNPTDKDLAIVLFVGEILQQIKEIQTFGGTFKKISIPITKCHPDAILPKYATAADAGMDVYTIEDVTIQPGETLLLRTGLKMAVPGGYYMMGVPKSGISLKTKTRLSNSPGTIDAGYRGEVGVIVDNIGQEPIHFTKGSKICQLILQKIPHVSWNEISEEEFEKISNTDRGSGGYGSTGT